jgi:hypothetical protein
VHIRITSAQPRLRWPPGYTIEVRGGAPTRINRADEARIEV